MEKDNGMGAFFASPFAKEYLKCSDNLIRRSVTGISAACELMRGKAEKNDDRTECELIDGIMTMCCDLVRNAELSKALASGAPSAEDMKTVRADLFLAEFAAECEAVSCGRCRVSVKDAPAAFINTDRNTLRFLLLIFVRRVLLGCDGESAGFVIECAGKLKTLNITVRSLRTFVDEGAILTPDVFDEYPHEICSGLAERIGASAVLDRDSLSVEIPLSGGSGPAIVAAPEQEPRMGFFNPFGLMLRGI